MGKTEHLQESIASESVKTALGGLAVCGILAYLNEQFGILTLLKIDLYDLQMIGICVVLFAVLWPLLGNVFFLPFLKLIEAREKATVGADQYCQDKARETVLLVDKYESRMFDVRSSSLLKKQTVVNAAKSEGSKILEQAQKDAQSLVLESRAKIADQLSKSESGIAADIEALASAVVSRVVAPSSESGFVKFNFLLITLLISASVLLFVPELFASTVEGAHEAGHHVPAFWDLKYFIFNFTLYLIGVIYLVKKFAPTAWASRRTRIIDTIESSKSKIQKVDREYSQAKEKLNSLERDAKELEVLIEKESQLEASAVLQSAKSSAERIISQAKNLALAEEKAAERSLRRRLVERAMKEAENRLLNTINSENDRKIRERAQAEVQAIIH